MDFDFEMREGILFDENQLYAVWDDADIKNLINRLGMCITDTQ